MIVERIFQLIAAALTVAAGYFFWTGWYDASFISAVLSAVAFFLSVRSQVRGRLKVLEADRANGQSAPNADDAAEDKAGA